MSEQVEHLPSSSDEQLWAEGPATGSADGAGPVPARAGADELLRRYAAGERDLHGAELEGAELSLADLTGIDLSGANLRGARLSGAILHRAVLRGARLAEADLSFADLHSADLRDADLRDADMTAAIVIRTRFKGAILPDGTRWGAATARRRGRG